ncbi:hypothetical protein bpmyx0001_49420 [Bacillus pseudomycoides DSM 12442]|nr:hypothetical protein bpmyx0001_49420 [Bacillus pseudomycoides DSM 12442]
MRLFVFVVKKDFGYMKELKNISNLRKIRKGNIAVTNAVIK